MQSNLRGELTSGTEPAMQDFDLVDAVARSLKLTSPNELSQLGATLFPAMLNTAVLEGDIKKVIQINIYYTTVKIALVQKNFFLHGFFF